MQHVLEDFVLQRRLYQLGFLEAAHLLEALDAPAQQVEQAIVAYQVFHGLQVDGWVGPETEASLLELRYCGYPDVLHLENPQQVCRWPQKVIRWSITGQLVGISLDNLQAAYQLAWLFWSTICDIHPEYLGFNVATAHVLMGTGVIDGGLGTLAWSEMPCGNPRQLKQLYDSNERWVIAEGATQNQQIDLVRVAAHEIGHVLGIPHIVAGNLLAPIYSQQIRKPQVGDIAEAVKRYGPSIDTPPPPGDDIVVVFPQPITRLILRRG